MRKTSSTNTQKDIDPIEEAIQNILIAIGENPNRIGLKKTPYRVAKSYRFLMQGYSIKATDITKAVFKEKYNEMVIVRDIEFYSLCEHHMLPFFGKVHIAYIPNGKILGLSKLVRLVEIYARRLQVQERLTEQIADALQDSLNPAGVAVIIEASHMCMMMRGVQTQSSKTITSAMRKCFLEQDKSRKEFLDLLKK